MTAFIPEQKSLQAGLTVGMSATAGFHHSPPNPVPADMIGANTLPASEVRSARDRIDLPAVNGPVQVSPLCIGAWPWGDKGTWHWDEDQLPAVRAAWRLLYDAGVNYIDTAQVYGDGRSEEIVGELIRDLPRDSVVVQTKYLGLPADPSNYMHTVDAPLRKLKATLARTKLDYVDVYMVHGPIHPQSIDSVAKGMAQCIEAGLARVVGIANYDRDGLVEFADALKAHGVPLALHQVEYSVLRRLPEQLGEVTTCRERGIVFQGYSSLANGRLSGKYTPDYPPPRTYRFSNYNMKDVMPTVGVLEEIGRRHGGKAPASVALNWCVSKGALPVVGIRNEEQARQAVDALGWRLTEEEVAEVDRHSLLGYTTKLWQRG